MMLYIGLFIVLLIVALLFCDFYRKNIDSPEQKLLKDFEKKKKEFEKRVRKKNEETGEEYEKDRRASGKNMEDPEGQ